MMATSAGSIVVYNTIPRILLKRPFALKVRIIRQDGFFCNVSTTSKIIEKYNAPH